MMVGHAATSAGRRGRRWLDAWLLGAVCLSTPAGMVGQAVTELAEPTTLMVRAYPPGNQMEVLELMQLLAAVVEHPTATVKKGEDVFTLLRQRCGGARTELIQMVHKLNPGLTLPIADRSGDIILPPCPFWTDKTKIEVAEGTDLRKLMAIQMGTAGNTSLDQVTRLNTNLDPDHITPGQEITLPYVSRPVSYTLKAAYRSRSEEVQQRLKRFGSVSERNTGGGFRLVEPLSPAATGYPCDKIVNDPTWPFDAGSLARILKYNRSRRVPRSSLAVVADTGIELTERRLPLEASDDGTDPNFDLDMNGFFGDRFGVNLEERRGFPACQRDPSRPDDPAFSHGTHVAGLVAGQAFGPELGRAAAARLALKILNLRHSDVKGSPQGPVRYNFSMPIGGLLEASIYATSVGAKVLNLSVETSDPTLPFFNALPNTSFAAVVAAGNDYKNLDDDDAQVYPALYGRKGSDRLIVVAAFKPGGELADFSNRGAKTVDLAAPGVCIQSLMPGGKTGVLSGTSQAAPLVSFAAALLAGEGLLPAAIKRRIMMTVDVQRGFPVVSEGRLNIAKAVSCYDDQIEVEDRGLLRGRFAGTAKVTIGGVSRGMDQIQRVLPRYAEGEAKPLKAFVVGRTGEIQEVFSARAEEVLLFRVNGATKAESFALAKILDLVPHRCVSSSR